MKRWDKNEHKQVEDAKIDRFLIELMELCQKHGFSIAHEDTHGGFIIEEYNVNNIDWIGAATRNVKE